MKYLAKMNINGERQQGIQNSMRFVVILANCFALLPVEGISSPSTSDLKFTWKSLKVVYVIIVLTAAVGKLGVGLIYLFKDSSFDMIGRKAIQTAISTLKSLEAFLICS